MWHDRIHGQSSSKYSFTLPSFMSSLLEFHVSPTLLCLQCSIIVLTYGGCAVPRPCTSTQISTPASAAALPHGMSDLPICSSVFSTLTSFGSALGRTFTPLPPTSAVSSTKRLHVSICFSTSFLSGEWNSQVVPQPQIVTPASANFFLTSLRASLLSDGSTPCLCVVRSSTGEMPVALHTFRRVSRSQAAATL